MPLLHDDPRFRDIELKWETNCLSDSSSIGSSVDDSALVLTVTISKLGQSSPQSLSGFTASFKQFPRSELLRLDLKPTSPVPKSPAEDWRNPPAHLRLDHLLPNKIRLSNLLDQRLQELDLLKAQRQELEQLITAKEEQIKLELRQQGTDVDFDYEFQNCETFDCAFEAISHRVKDAFNFIYYRITSYRWNQATLNYPASGRIPYPNMHSGTSGSSRPFIPNVSYPPPAYLPVHSSSQTSPYVSYEKLPDENTSRPQFAPQESRRRHPLIAVLHFVLVLFGLIALVAFIRRRCASLRTRTERAANREERRNRRAFRRAARRAAWKNWWNSGWGRRRDQERRMDYEEKRALIQEQESRLEGAMHDEIMSLRHAHGVVDELVRAEEGRGTHTQPVIVRGRMPGMASIAGIMMGQNLYSTTHLSGTTAISETEDGSTVLTPPTSTTFSRSMSRSNSLPSYRTNPANASAPSSRYADSDVDNRSLFSEPPAYQTDPEDSDDESHAGMVGVEIVTNGFTQYAPSEYASSLLSPTDTASIFTPDSSIPDVSPRESAETVRTFM